MTSDVSLRDVNESDLPTFYDQQLDPEATRMAAFPSRDRDAFMAHWRKILGDKSLVVQTIIFDGAVAGNIGCWVESDERRVGYWIGKSYWGKGIATAALSQFLSRMTARPLFARVAKHNIASIRVLQKCGFTTAGEDGFQLKDGEHDEEYILVLEASEQAGARCADGPPNKSM